MLSILWPENTKKSQPNCCTSTLLCGIYCAESTMHIQSLLTDLTYFIIFSTSGIVPTTFDACVIEKIFVFSVIVFLNSSKSNCIFSLSTYKYFSFACVFLHTSCQVTKLLWCSIIDMTISSSSFKLL